MSTHRTRRIHKEIAEVEKDKQSQISVDLAQGDDYTHLKGMFPGPPDTPYAGGRYVIDIKIPSDYPFRPPVMRFETKIWHPNVSSVTGAICLDTLSSAWSPVLTMKSALISLQSLLSTPEPKDPQDAEVASMMIKTPEQFEHKAREWAIRYAGAPRKETGEGSGGVTSEKIRQASHEQKVQAKKESAANKIAQYRGYNPDLVNRFCAMGFSVVDVVAAMEFIQIDKNGGEDYELEEEYMGDITARLFGEP